jgi:hypothetical protein
MYNNSPRYDTMRDHHRLPAPELVSGLTGINKQQSARIHYLQNLLRSRQLQLVVSHCSGHRLLGPIWALLISITSTNANQHQCKPAPMQPRNCAPKTRRAAKALLTRQCDPIWHTDRTAGKCMRSAGSTHTTHTRTRTSCKSLPNAATGTIIYDA